MDRTTPNAAATMSGRLDDFLISTHACDHLGYCNGDHAYLILYKFDRGKAKLKKVRHMPHPLGIVERNNDPISPAQFTVPMPY